MVIDVVVWKKCTAVTYWKKRLTCSEALVDRYRAPAPTDARVRIRPCVFWYRPVLPCSEFFFSNQPFYSVEHWTVERNLLTLLSIHSHLQGCMTAEYCERTSSYGVDLKVLWNFVPSTFLKGDLSTVRVTALISFRTVLPRCWKKKDFYKNPFPQWFVRKPLAITLGGYAGWYERTNYDKRSYAYLSYICRYLECICSGCNKSKVSSLDCFVVEAGGWN